ncbi:hypothetical protein [Breznakibacter xylanolyticus]|nr:hypothetical protein [Breznakibacter xylanolyticus]MBN2743807.1 hypothetical protein [Marinilabiliaceae bacterium]
MEYGLMFDKLKRMIEEDPDNVSILEETIDVNLQMKYFRVSVKAKKDLDADGVLAVKNNLFDESIPVKDKKKLLAQLASVNKVEAFRTIEQYMQSPDKELKAWAVLALQESRMLIHSVLMDKSPVFISTGLGGRKNKLRYFVVFVTRNGEPFSAVQQSLLSGELDFFAKKYQAEVEEVKFSPIYATASILIPLRESVKDFLSAVINNCNELGDFLFPSFMVTNVKRLSNKEILKAINESINPETEGEETLDVNLN